MLCNSYVIGLIFKYTRFPLIDFFRGNVIRIGNNVESKNRYEWETSVYYVIIDCYVIENQTNGDTG